MPSPRASEFNNGAPPFSRGRGAIRRLPIFSDLPLDLPITTQEIQMVAEALGAEIAALFTGDD